MTGLFFPDLESVLLHYGVEMPYSYSGMGYIKILCPVHDERNPSATVNLEVGRINCHACGFHGDGLDLIKEREHVGTSEASEFARQHFPPAGNKAVRGRAGGLSRSGVSDLPGSRRRDRGSSSSRLRRTRTRWD